MYSFLTQNAVFTFNTFLDYTFDLQFQLHLLFMALWGQNQTLMWTCQNILKLLNYLELVRPYIYFITSFVPQNHPRKSEQTPVTTAGAARTRVRACVLNNPRHIRIRPT